MAGNAHALADPADGHYEDWFELFNAGSEAFNLTGYYLTDDLSNKTKFQIPDGVVIPPGGFLLVWADNEATQNGNGGDVHANFQLNAMAPGESLGLFTVMGTQIDAVSCGAQAQNESHGRFPDGQTQQTSRLYEPTPRILNVAP